MASLNSYQVRWLNALENGDYEQGLGSMRNDKKGRPRYCCMGVACEVLGYELHRQMPDSNVFGVLAVDTEHADNAASVVHNLMPRSINERLGLTLADDVALASMNDGRWSFLDIAATLRFVWLNDMSVVGVYAELCELRSFLASLEEFRGRTIDA